MTILGIIFLSVSGLLLFFSVVFHFSCNNFKKNRIKENLWVFFILSILLNFISLISTDIIKVFNYV